MKPPNYPPDAGSCPGCGAAMWFRPGVQVPHVGAHQQCYRCGGRWKMVGEHGERVPFADSDAATGKSATIALRSLS